MTPLPIVLWVMLAAAPEAPGLGQPTLYRVIVHDSNPYSCLTNTEISDLMLKRRASWSHGVPVSPVDLSHEAPERVAFSLDIHGRDVATIVASWTRRVFSGVEVPPPEIADDAAVIAFVRDDPGAIGYIKRSTPLAGVKELCITWNPKPVTLIRPVYTEMGLKAKVTGDVVLQVTVNAEGRVVEAAVLEKLGYGLDGAARRAVQATRFKPSTIDGEPAEVTFELRVKYRL